MAAMGRVVTVATCALNQWALDFEGNLARIFRSEWGGGGTGCSAGARPQPCGAGWLPAPGRREASLPPRVSRRGSGGGRACCVQPGSRSRGVPRPWASGQGGPGLSVRLVFNATFFQVLTSQRAKEPGTGLVLSSKSGKSALLVLGLVRSQ